MRPRHEQSRPAAENPYPPIALTGCAFWCGGIAKFRLTTVDTVSVSFGNWPTVEASVGARCDNDNVKKKAFEVYETAWFKQHPYP